MEKQFRIIASLQLEINSTCHSLRKLQQWNFNQTGKTKSQILLSYFLMILRRESRISCVNFGLPWKNFEITCRQNNRTRLELCIGIFRWFIAMFCVRSTSTNLKVQEVHGFTSRQCVKIPMQEAACPAHYWLFMAGDHVAKKSASMKKQSLVYFSYLAYERLFKMHTNLLTMQAPIPQYHSIA